MSTLSFDPFRDDHGHGHGHDQGHGRGPLRPRRRPRPAALVAVAAAALAAALCALMLFPLASSARAASPAALAACPFWSDVTPPARSVTPWIAPQQTATAVDFSTRLAAPAGITGTLSGDQVSLTFDRVPGAAAYRVWRNGQSVAWITDEGQATFTTVDTAPCLDAFYTVAAMTDQSGSDASLGQLSQPYQLDAAGGVEPWATPVGSTIPMLVTSYNDVGQTATGYDSQLGVCAVDPRVIPWGRYFTVPGYGTCFAGDIGTWIQNDTVDVWLPGGQADDWGVQDRTVTIIADPYATAPSSPSPTVSATPSPTPTSSPSPTLSPTPSPTPTPSSNPTTTPPASGNLLANAGFESGALTPWTCDAGTAAVVTAPVHSGSAALQITPTSSDDAQCTQTVAVAPDTTYTLSAWVEGDYAYLGATVPGGTGSSAWTPAAASWTQLTTSFTTGVATTSVSVYIHGWYVQPAVDVDDVSLTG